MSVCMWCVYVVYVCAPPVCVGVCMRVCVCTVCVCVCFRDCCVHVRLCLCMPPQVCVRVCVYVCVLVNICQEGARAGGGG